MPKTGLPTWEIMRLCMPTRDEKKRIARALGYNNDSSLYKWCEDPDGSGRMNPLDKLDVILDHARLYHPHAAFGIAHHIEAGNARAVAKTVEGRTPAEILSSVQPGAEKETTEALHTISRNIRTLLLDGQADLPGVLQEIDEAERELERARVILTAAVEHEQRVHGGG